MKKYLPLYITLLLSTAGHFGYAQNNNTAKADEEFANFNFKKAIQLYDGIYAKKKSAYVERQIAEANFNINNYRDAETWYAKLANREVAQPADVYQYGRILKINGRFKEAKAQFQRYEEIEKNIDREDLNRLYTSCDSAIVWMDTYIKSVKVSNSNLLNTEQSEFAPQQEGDLLYFVSDRYAVANEPIYVWTGQPYLKLFQKEGEEIKHIPLANAAEKSHIGAITFNKEKKVAFFAATRSLDNKQIKKSKSDVTVNVELFEVSYENGQLGTEVKPFKYNRFKEWSVGDPYLSASGDTLYFASNMPGGFGGSDLYYSINYGDGNWSDPVNLGPQINTKHDERFPTFDHKGNLLFSSDGHIGIGGLDIFRATKVGSTYQVENLKFPINSPQDDFSLTFFDDNKGFLASNRSGGKGADDLYEFDLKRQFEFSLKGIVLNKKSNLPIAGALVTLHDLSKSKEPLNLYANDKGEFNIPLDDEQDYEVEAAQTGFIPEPKYAFTTKGLTESQTLPKNFYLTPVEVKQVVVLRNIYFDFDKSDIRPDAAIELDKILSFLNSDPKVRIELSAHTDSRGKAAYNMKLSQRRADAAVAYLVAHGIDENRLVAKGFGFSQLANHCAPGVKCTEEEHEFNRRVEFVVTAND